MANAGFFAKFIDGSTDNACCGYCRKNLDGWEPADDPWEEHKSHSPTCPLANLSDPINRELTFTMGLWPHTKSISASQMAKAGFFFWPRGEDEEDDTAICVQCGLALDGWEPNDDPWHEHSRRRPKCPILVSGKLHAPSYCELMLASLPTENALRELIEEPPKMVQQAAEPVVQGRLLERLSIDNKIKSLFQTPPKAEMKSPLKLAKPESPKNYAPPPIVASEVKLPKQTPLRLSTIKAPEKVEPTPSRKSTQRRTSTVIKPTAQEPKDVPAFIIPEVSVNIKTPSMKATKGDTQPVVEAPKVMPPETPNNLKTSSLKSKKADTQSLNETAKMVLETPISMKTPSAKSRNMNPQPVVDAPKVMPPEPEIPRNLKTPSVKSKKANTQSLKEAVKTILETPSNIKTPSVKSKKIESQPVLEAPKPEKKELSPTKSVSPPKPVPIPASPKVPISTVKRGRAAAAARKADPEPHAIVSVPSFFAAPSAPTAAVSSPPKFKAPPAKAPAAPIVTVSSPKFKAPPVKVPVLATPVRVKEVAPLRSTVKRQAAKRSGFLLDDDPSLSARPSLGPVESIQNTPLSKRSRAAANAADAKPVATTVVDGKAEASKRRSAALQKLKGLQIGPEDLKKSLGDYLQSLVNRRMTSFDHLVTENQKKLVV